MYTDYDADLENYSSVAKLALALIGTMSDQKTDHKLRIQKLAFLADKMIHDPDLDDDLDFVPLDMGPFSENLETTIEKLTYEGLITVADSHTLKSKLTRKGKRAYSKIKKKFPKTFRVSKMVNEDMKNLSSKEIARLVFELYPSMKDNSIAKDDHPKIRIFDSFHVDISELNSVSTMIVKTQLGRELKISIDNDSNLLITGGR